MQNLFTIVQFIIKNWDTLKKLIDLYNQVSGDLKPLIAELTKAMQGSTQKAVASAAHDYSVEALQTALNAAGADPKLAVDGVYGAATAQAVKDFQSKYGIKPDGWYGVETAAKLQEIIGSHT